MTTQGLSSQLTSSSPGDLTLNGSTALVSALPASP